MIRFLVVLLVSVLMFSGVAFGKKNNTDSESLEVDSDSFDLKIAMKTLLPSISDERVKLVSDVITKRAKVYGFTKKDYPMILAMIMVESTFQNIQGTSGEVGMLQVIPAEKHIRAIVAKLKCVPLEKYCTDTGRPDITHKGMILTAKVKQFLLEHPKYALEVGLGEMKFWQKRYDRRLKKLYWQSYPEWYLSQKVVNYWTKKDDLQKWWKMVHDKVGDLGWTSHYNWGSNLISGGVNANYSMRVLKYYNKVLGRKAYQKFSPMKADDNEEVKVVESKIVK